MNEQQTAINALNEELTGIRATLTTLAPEVGAIGTGVTSLETTVASLQQQIRDLQGQTTVDLSVLQATADALVQQVGGVKTAADAVVAKLPAPAGATA